jgi:hypothetical protein
MERHHRNIRKRLFPLWLKLLYSMWVAFLLPTYWQSTPLGLLWSCNVALLLTCVGLWLESRLLISIAALGIVWWQLLWVLDFLIHLAIGISTLGMSNYMFDARFSRFSRGLSLYHGWLPFVLLWALSRLGYDRRALIFQTLLAWTVFLLSASLTTDLTGPAGNLNMIYGLSETKPQTWMPPKLWLVVVMVLWPASVYVPCHFVFRRAFARNRHAAHR